LFFPNVKLATVLALLKLRKAQQEGDGMDLDSVGLEYGAYNNNHHLTQRFYKGTM
jgi:hypothetical protein